MLSRLDQCTAGETKSFKLKTYQQFWETAGLVQVGSSVEHQVYKKGMKLTCDHQQREAYLAPCDYAIEKDLLEKKQPRAT